MSTLLYNPDRKDKQQFLDEFVIRTDIFDDIFNDIRTSKMVHPEQHYLIVGQRGTGKTTLITRLKYAIEDDPKLNSNIIPVVFGEEQYNISELANLWENIATYLEDYHGFEGISDAIEKLLAKENFEEAAFDVLIKYLDNHKKKIILFIDNIGDLLAKFEDLEIRRVREILQTKPHIRLIAGSVTALDSTQDYLQPLFEFFKTIQLKGLSYDECITLLMKLAALHGEKEKIEQIIKQTPSRIETLRTLSGGVPRTIALLFQVFVDNEHGDSLSDLEKVLDAVTPLYKHRMDDLPKQQQKIVDAVAKNWDAISVKELTEKLRLESKVISAQLRQLEKSQVIEKRTTGTKNHLYLLRERFFNIWYLMRYGRKQDRERVIWLVKFLEIWCDENELEQRIFDYVRKSRNGQLDTRIKELYGEVYSFFTKVKPEVKGLLKEHTIPYIASKIEVTDEEFDKFLDECTTKEDWERLAQIIFNKNTFSFKHKEKLFNIIKDNRKLQKEIYNSVFLTRIMEHEEEREINEWFSYFTLVGIIFYMRERLFSILNNTDEQNIRKAIELFEIFYDGIVRDVTINEYSHLFLPFIVDLLVKKNYQIAKSLVISFQRYHDSKFQVDEILLCVIQYLENNQNPVSFERLGNEKKEIAFSFVKRILSYQNAA